KQYCSAAHSSSPEEGGDKTRRVGKEQTDGLSLCRSGCHKQVGTGNGLLPKEAVCHHAAPVCQSRACWEGSCSLLDLLKNLSAPDHSSIIAAHARARVYGMSMLSTQLGFLPMENRCCAVSIPVSGWIA